LLFRQPKTNGSMRVLSRPASDGELARRSWKLIAEQMRRAKQGGESTASTSMPAAASATGPGGAVVDPHATVDATQSRLAPVVFWGMASELMQLKYLDPENDEVVGPKTIKLRWQFHHTPVAGESHATAVHGHNNDNEDDGNENSHVHARQVRLQLPFKDRTTLSVTRDVLPHIFAHTRKKAMVCLVTRWPRCLCELICMRERERVGEYVRCVRCVRCMYIVCI
jgi:hypothetical protein